MALSDREKQQIETDARQDRKDDTTRSYPKSAVTDIIFSLPDALTGSQSTYERANEKKAYYDEVRESLDRRK